MMCWLHRSRLCVSNMVTSPLHVHDPTPLFSSCSYLVSALLTTSVIDSPNSVERECIRCKLNWNSWKLCLWTCHLCGRATSRRHRCWSHTIMINDSTTSLRLSLRVNRCTPCAGSIGAGFVFLTWLHLNYLHDLTQFLVLF